VQFFPQVHVLVLDRNDIEFVAGRTRRGKSITKTALVVIDSQNTPLCEFKGTPCFCIPSPRPS
jgi:hypothetical protein